MSATSSLITLRSLLDLEVVRAFEWDPDTLISLSKVDRAGDLSARVVEEPGVLSDLAAEGFSPSSAVGHALSRELHDAVQRRIRLWVSAIPTDDIERLRDALGDGLVHEAGTPAHGMVPIALSPIEILEAWVEGSAEQKEFIRVAMAGLDTLTTSSAAARAARKVGASIIERPSFLRLCRNPKFIAYIVVFVYSMARALPVMYVPHFRGDWRILWGIDIITAIPYTWGIIEMVAGKKWWNRLIGFLTTAITFFTPYVYFWMYGRHAPRGVWFAVAVIFFSGILLELFRYLRDTAVKRGLRASHRYPTR